MQSNPFPKSTRKEGTLRRKETGLVEKRVQEQTNRKVLAFKTKEIRQVNIWESLGLPISTR